MHASEPIPSDMQSALDRFRDEARQILNSLLSEVHSRELPPIIYHYTDDSGLKGILETGKVWLSDIFSLNDPSELSHGFSIFIDALNSRANNGPPENRTFAASVRSFLDRIQDSAQYFICSFSATGDDLGQWRAYADNGHGYALGFDAKVLKTAFEVQDPVQFRIAPHFLLPTTMADLQRYMTRWSTGCLTSSPCRAGGISQMWLSGHTGPTWPCCLLRTR